MCFHAAIDMSGKSVCFALKKFKLKDMIIKDTYFPNHMKDKMTFVGLIKKTCEDKGIFLQDISYWTIGTGPGSYTGLRSAAAFVAGITFNRNNIFRRGLPTAFALARDINANPGDTVGVFYPGRREDMLIFFVKIFKPRQQFTDNGGSGVFTNPEEAMEKLSECNIYVSLSENRSRIINFFRQTNFQDNKLHCTDKIRISNLLFLNTDSWENDSIKDLKYIRPAVYHISTPKSMNLRR